jgi:hypothetical protein
MWVQRMGRLDYVEVVASMRTFIVADQRENECSELRRRLVSKGGEASK